MVEDQAEEEVTHLSDDTSSREWETGRGVPLHRETEGTMFENQPSCFLATGTEGEECEEESGGQNSVIRNHFWTSS